MRHRFVLWSLCLVIGLLIVPAIASAQKSHLELIPCSTPGFSVCYGGGGDLTFKHGSITIDGDGDVTVNMKGITGRTTVEGGPPYTLEVFFFGIPLVNQYPDLTPPPVGRSFTTRAKSDEYGNYHGKVGNVQGPVVGF